MRLFYKINTMTSPQQFPTFAINILRVNKSTHFFLRCWPLISWNFLNPGLHCSLTQPNSLIFADSKRFVKRHPAKPLCVELARKIAQYIESTQTCWITDRLHDYIFFAELRITDQINRGAMQIWNCDLCRFRRKSQWPSELAGSCFSARAPSFSCGTLTMLRLFRRR